MEQILRLFYNNGSFFTFCALQVLCFYLIINHNSAQSAIAAETWSIGTGRYQSVSTTVNDYFDLREQNEVQMRENARLRRLLPNALYDLRANVDSIIDGKYLQRYNFLPASIVNRSPYSPNNFLVINRGENLGISPGQGIIDDRGLVGIVDRSTELFARVISILHQDTRISAGLKDNTFGTLRWDGQDPRHMTLTDIPDYTEIGQQDTVFTTGYSNVFPTGHAIGLVTGTEIQAGTGSMNLQVSLFNDPLRVSSVYVVQDLFKEELGILNAQ